MFMKKITRVLILVFSFTMIITIFHIKKVEAKTTAKRSVVYTLKNGTLTVKGRGAMTKKMVFKGNKKIKKVIIKKGVTSIYGSAFKNCKKLKSVKISNSVKMIGKYAFYNCNQLKNIKIGNKVKTIGKCAFYNVTATKITIPKSIDTIGVNAFGGCKKLKNVTMPGKNIKVSTLADLEIPKFLPHVKTIRFSTNLNIDAVTYYNTENYAVNDKDKKYKSINGVIYTKDGKTTVRLPNRAKINIAEGTREFTMKSVLYSGYLGDDMHVYNCQLLEELVLPKTVNKISVGKDFEYDYQNVDFPNALQKLGLKEVVIQNKQIGQDSIKILTEPFSKDFKIEYIENEKGDNLIRFTEKTQT